MEEEENINVDSAKVGTDKTVWTTGKYEIDNNSGQLSRRITVGKNTAQGLAISDPSSGLAVSDLVWRPKIGDYMVDNTPAELRVLQNRLDEYARLSTNLIFRKPCELINVCKPPVMCHLLMILRILPIIVKPRIHSPLQTFLQAGTVSLENLFCQEVI